MTPTATFVSKALQAGAWLSGHDGWGICILLASAGLYGAVRHVKRSPEHHGAIGWIPFSFPRRRAASWKRHTSRANLQHVPIVAGADRSHCGERLTVQLVDGTTSGDVAANAARLASALKVRRVHVEPHPDRADRATVHVIRTDPFATARLWPGAGADGCDWREPIPVGVDLYGREVHLDLGADHLLIAGVTGSGKSNATHLIVAAAALDPSVQLHVFDGKQGVEMRPWRHVAQTFLRESSPQHMDAAIRRLAQLAHVVDSRYERLYEAGLRKAPASMPPMVIVIDELAAWLVDCGKPGRVFGEILMGMIRKARAAGCAIVATTQRPSHDVIDTSLRSQFAYRWAMRVLSPADSDIILGPGHAKRGYSAAALSQSNKGEGLLLHEEALPVLCRAYHLPDADLFRLAETAESLRSPAGETAPDQPRDAEPFPRVSGSLEIPQATSGNGNGDMGMSGEVDLSIYGQLKDRDRAALGLLGDPQTAAGLMEALGLARSRTDAMLARLGGLGLLERSRRDPGQGNRSPWVYRLTSEGGKMAESLRARGTA